MASPTRQAAAVISVLTGAALLLASGRAAAFTIETSVTAGCHESITAEALRRVRAALPTAPAIASDDNELALIDDVPFSLDDDLRDIGSTSLLIGVRDNDLKGRSPLDVAELAGVHGDPLTQLEHCLRSPGQDQPGGSEAALASCHGYIRTRVLQAIDALDASGKPDPATRASVPVVLSVRGLVYASLPAFYYRMGQALHALEDGFAHTYRTADGMRVTVVLNYVELASDALDEGRDGPPHKDELDRCDDVDELRTKRRELATDAATELLRAALDPALDRAGKEAAIDGVLSKYLGYEPGCTHDNGWCNAPEAGLSDGRGGCALGGPSTGPGALGLGSLAAAAMLLTWRAARRSRRTRRGLRAMGVLFAAICALAPLSARAQPAASAAPAAPEPPTPAAIAVATGAADPAPPPKAGEPPRVVERLVTTEEAKKEHVESARSIFSLYTAGSVSVDKPAIAASVGVRLRLGDSWAVGLDGELNPYYGLQSKSFRMGSFNGYGTLIRRFPMRFEAANLRTSAHLGTSVLLMDLYGAPSGSTGVFMGLSPLGVEFKVSRALYVILDPINIAVAAPQLSGTPFIYQQYRFTVGFEFAPW